MRPGPLTFPIVLIVGLLGGSTASAQRAVYLVRHAEKGTLPAGDPSLTPAGVDRARALARILKTADIKAIYVSNTRRSRETAAPIAADLHLTPVEVTSGDPAATAAAIKRDHKDDVVLVVGHSNTVGTLVKSWEPTASITIDESSFDSLFVVVPEGPSKGSWSRFRYGPAD